MSSSSAVVVANPLLRVAQVASPDLASNDAFGRVRTSEPTVLFDSKQIYDGQPLLWALKTEGSASTAFSSDAARTRLTVTAGATDRAVRQTRQVFNYEPGKSHLVFATFNANGGVANVDKNVGYFNDDNGCFFSLSGATPRFRIRTSTSGSPALGTDVAQASWNLDTMDGNGPSGVTLDFTKVQILAIDLEWLGVGSVRFGWVVDGTLIYAHQARRANVETVVYMSTPNLPVRYEIDNTAASAGGTLDSICAVVISEGGERQNGQTFAADRGATTLNPSGSQLQSLVGIRLRSNRLGPVRPTRVSVISDSASNFRWALLLNPTRGSGTAPVWVTVDGSQVERDVTSTEALSGGTVLASGYGSQSVSSSETEFSQFVALGQDVDSVKDEMVLAIQQVGGAGSETFIGSLNFSEF